MTVARAARTTSRKKKSATAAAVDHILGIDPHKRTLTATVVDGRGGVVATEHFKVSGDGHRAMEAWALSFGPVARWGVEGASGLGRHTAMFLIGRRHDVRDCCATRTADRARRRLQGKSDALDAERIARETLADSNMPLAFKRAAGDPDPDETTELMALWHNARRSLLKTRQHLLNEAEALLVALPEAVRGELPVTKRIRPRLTALTRRDRSITWDAPTALRLELLEEHAKAIAALDDRERHVIRQLAALVRVADSTLDELCGLDTRSTAELLVEVGDPSRFTEGGFARFNGTAPLPASSGEGPNEPVRHRLNRGGNRRVNAVLYRMAVTQLRCEPRAQKLYADARRDHSKKEAMRILKRQLSNVVWRRMVADAERRQGDRMSVAEARSSLHTISA
jgi:transposase